MIETIAIANTNTETEAETETKFTLVQVHADTDTDTCDTDSDTETDDKADADADVNTNARSNMMYTKSNENSNINSNMNSNSNTNFYANTNANSNAMDRFDKLVLRAAAQKRNEILTRSPHGCAKLLKLVAKKAQCLPKQQQQQQQQRSRNSSSSSSSSSCVHRQHQLVDTDTGRDFLLDNNYKSTIRNLLLDWDKSPRIRHEKQQHRSFSSLVIPELPIHDTGAIDPIDRDPIDRDPIDTDTDTEPPPPPSLVEPIDTIESNERQVSSTTLGSIIDDSAWHWNLAESPTIVADTTTATNAELRQSLSQRRFSFEI